MSKSLRIKAALITCVALFLMSAQAENCSCRSSQFDSLSDIRSMLLPAQFIVGAEPTYSADFRREKGYSAAEMDRRFGATGTIECGGKRNGSANIVGRRDVLITAQHVLWDTKTCTQRRDCKFITSMNNTRVERQITSSVKKAMSCPLDPRLDWDVAILASGVPDGIEPYQLGDSQTMQSGDPTLAVNGMAADFFEYRSGQIAQDAAGRDIKPKSFSECHWGPVGAGVSFGGLIATNCSAAIQSSGSALLNSNRELVGVATMSTESSTALQERLNITPFVAKTCTFNTSTCATYYQPVVGDFRAAVEAAINSTGI